MIGSFYRDLKGNDADRKAPKAVIKELNKELPKGYHYEYDEKRNHLIIKGTSSKKQNEMMNVTIDLEEVGIPKDVPKEKIPEYLYRTQKRVQLHNAVISKDGKKLKIDDMNVDPLTGEGVDEKIIQFLIPAEFPPAAPMTFQTKDGSKQIILFRRQPYDSFEAVKFANENFPALKVEWIISDYANNADGNMTIDNPLLKISVTPKDAESVSDAVMALKIFKGYIDGSLIMEGTKLGRNLSGSAGVDMDALDERLELWENFEKLERILDVKFEPFAEIPEEDKVFFYELQQMFLNDADIVNNEPFDHFHLGAMKFSGRNMSEKDLIGKENMSFSYINEHVKATFLGAEFELYETVVLTGFTIVDVIKDKEKGKGGCEIYIKNSYETPWRLIRRYSLSYEAAKKHAERMHHYIHNNMG